MASVQSQKGECMKVGVKLACLAVLGAAALGSLTPVARAQDEAQTTDRAEKAKKTAGPVPVPVEVPADYVIGADDTLHVAVWKEPDLSATLPVRPDGKISLPLLNDLQASGLTPMQLADSITQKLKKYIADP